jgi:hypothetical protein
VRLEAARFVVKGTGTFGCFEVSLAAERIVAVLQGPKHVVLAKEGARVKRLQAETKHELIFRHLQDMSFRDTEHRKLGPSFGYDKARNCQHDVPSAK